MDLLRCSIAVSCIAIALGARAGTPTASPDAREALEGAALSAALARGGLTLYFRHGRTNFSQSDRDDDALANCAAQRNLSAAGRGDASAIGEAMRAMKLRISEVLASPYCRTLETARLMVGRAQVSRDVLGHMTTGGKPDYSALDRILASPPPQATLRVVVSHGNPFQALAGAPELAEGEAAVVKGYRNRWVIVARIRPADWPALVAARLSGR
jgi:phosphohistidine phosphatase SixA